MRGKKLAKSDFLYQQECPHCKIMVVDLTKHLLAEHTIRIYKLKCKTRKTGYKTKQQALEAIKNILNNDGPEYRRYTCGSCGEYHLTDVHYG